MRLTFTAICLLLVVAAGAQTHSLRGRITGTQQEPLPGAYAIVQYPWGEEVKGTATNAQGRFSLDGLEPGGYRLALSFLGYEPVTLEFEIKDKDLDMGTLTLVESALNLESVEVTEKAPTATQREDTLQFNATAFKVMRDANAEDLVTKMPSVTLENGKVRAQGEDIGQVLVDGKPFFGNDPSAALKNLPAEVIDKIQIFDQASEQARFSGIQDGNTTKTMNIVTKSGMNNGQFGKVYAGFGWPDYYQAGGQVNLFDGNRRISLIGMSNNINVQNFSEEDLLGISGSSRRRGPGGPPGGFRGQNDGFLVNGQGGISRTTAIGLNYSDQWGKSTEVTGSYFFNTRNNHAESDLARQFLTGGELGELYAETSTTDSRNTNHRANLRIDITLDSANSILFRPRATWQGNRGDESSFSSTTGTGGLLNESSSLYSSDLKTLQFDGSLMWRHKMHKDRRTFSLQVSPGLDPRSGKSDLLSVNHFLVPTERTDSLDQRASLDVSSWNLSANADYTEPLGKNDQLQFAYRGSYRQEESDKVTLDYDPLADAYSLPNDQLSNRFTNDYWTHSAGLGYSYNQGRTFNLMFRINYQWAELANEQTLPAIVSIRTPFRNVLPFAMLRMDIDKQRNLRVFYRSGTDLPSVEQLQNVLNNTNPLALSIGNPGLKQSVSHNIFVRYQYTDPATSQVFFLMGGGGLTQDAIGTATWLAGSDDPIFAELMVPSGAQLSRPVNLNGAWNFRSFMAYGFPLFRQKVNTNIDANYTYTRKPGLLDNQRNDADNHVLGLGLTFSSNISEKFDFTLAVRPALNLTKNSLQSSGDNLYFSQNSRFRLGWWIPGGIVLRSEISHQYNSGLADGYNQSYWLWNLALGKKLFRNQLGELALSMNDVLNQNRNINRTVTETYIEDSRSNALRQFVMLTFTYQVRNFRTTKAQTREEPTDDWRRFH